MLFKRISQATLLRPRGGGGLFYISFYSTDPCRPPCDNRSAITHVANVQHALMKDAKARRCPTELALQCAAVHAPVHLDAGLQHGAVGVVEEPRVALKVIAEFLGGKLGTGAAMLPVAIKHTHKSARRVATKVPHNLRVG